MTFPEAISSGFRNYVGFSDRASRTEFWFWILFTVLVGLFTTIIDLKILSSKIQLISSIWSLVTFLPSLAIGVRRLRGDTPNRRRLVVAPHLYSSNQLS